MIRKGKKRTNTRGHNKKQDLTLQDYSSNSSTSISSSDDDIQKQSSLFQIHENTTRNHKKSQHSQKKRKRGGGRKNRAVSSSTSETSNAAKSNNSSVSLNSVSSTDSDATNQTRCNKSHVTQEVETVEHKQKQHNLKNVLTLLKAKRKGKQSLKYELHHEEEDTEMPKKKMLKNLRLRTKAVECDPIEVPTDDTEVSNVIKKKKFADFINYFKRKNNKSSLLGSSGKENNPNSSRLTWSPRPLRKKISCRFCRGTLNSSDKNSSGPTEAEEDVHHERKRGFEKPSNDCSDEMDRADKKNTEDKRNEVNIEFTYISPFHSLISDDEQEKNGDLKDIVEEGDDVKQHQSEKRLDFRKRSASIFRPIHCTNSQQITIDVASCPHARGVTDTTRLHTKGETKNATRSYSRKATETERNIYPPLREYYHPKKRQPPKLTKDQLLEQTKDKMNCETIKDIVDTPYDMKLKDARYIHGVLTYNVTPYKSPLSRYFGYSK